METPLTLKEFAERMQREHGVEVTPRNVRYLLAEGALPPADEFAGALTFGEKHHGAFARYQALSRAGFSARQVGELSSLGDEELDAIVETIREIKALKAVHTQKELA